MNVFQIKYGDSGISMRRENILLTLLHTSVQKFRKMQHKDSFILSSVDYAVQRWWLVKVQWDLFIQTQNNQMCNTVHFQRVDFVLTAIRS